MSKNRLDHIAFILDGNKRWAKKNKLSLKEAYKSGLTNINKIIQISIENKVEFLTLFTLSSENLKRNSVGTIFQVIYDEFLFFFEEIIKEKAVRIKVIGSKNKLPLKIIELINHCEKETKNNNKLFLNLAFNYGFKDEIKSVFNKIISNKNIDINNDKNIKKLFFLGEMPDPDFLIRTGGEKRLSNFIMYNLTYTEIYFIEKLWPDFNTDDMNEIINNFKSINRSYGL